MAHARYVEEHLPGHPLANSRGNVIVHRRLLYERIGPGDHPCRHCGRTVRWSSRMPKIDALCVDHVNENWRDGSADNLIPSCWRCNMLRSNRGNPPWSRKV